MHGLWAALAGFCRALLAYVAVGGLIGGVIAGSPSDERICWSQHAILWIYSSCESGVFDALWFAAIGLPRFLIVLPAMAARWVFIVPYHVMDPWVVIDKGVYVVVDPRSLIVAGSAVAAIFLAGIVAWSMRARLVALLLGLAPTGQIAYIAIFP